MTTKGILFGRLTTDTKASANYDGKLREGWVCTCSCGNRTFWTETELSRTFSPHCGCDSAQNPIPDRCFTKPNLPEWVFVNPIRHRDEANKRIGEVWGTQTIVGVRGSRLEVVCSACNRVKRVSFRSWGAMPCSCRAWAMMTSNRKFIGSKLGKLTFESLALTASLTWHFHVCCECGARFTQSITRTREMFDRPDIEYKCPACSIELGPIKNQNRAKQWRKTHGGIPLCEQPKGVYRIRGAHYETTAVERTAKQKATPNLAPKGLVGSSIPRHLCGGR